MHPDQLDISLATARALIHGQFPQWRDEPVTPVEGRGTVNTLFRIGNHLVARLPLQPAGGAGDAVDRTRRWLESEAAAARELFGRTRFPTPEPVAIGEPSPGFPLPWAVQTWLPGTVAGDDDPGGSVPFAADLAEFIHGVRAIGTKGRRFTDTGRGGNLRAHDRWMQTCLERSQGMLDVSLLRGMWDDLRELPHTAPDAMTHGDLIPANVLVSGGRLAGVLDVGGLGPADPALDLVGAWHLLEPRPRRVLRQELGVQDLEWARGMAWAFEQAMGLVWYYADSNPPMSALGRRTLKRIVDAGLSD
jgi:aminoglycoside phosphotransferase (APT) family kinase protein